MQLRTQLHTQKGFTLIEIAIVLTIVGLIIGGIWLAASTVFSNNKTQALQKDVIQVIQNTKTLFAGQGSSAVTTGFTNANAATSGVVPSDMVTPTAGVLVTPFSTQTAASDVNFSAPTATTVGLQLLNIPSNACTQMLLTLGSLNNIQKLGIVGLSGGAGAQTPAAGGLVTGTVGVTTSVTAVNAAGACPAGNADSIAVDFNAF